MNIDPIACACRQAWETCIHPYMTAFHLCYLGSAKVWESLVHCLIGRGGCLVHVAVRLVSFIAVRDVLFIAVRYVSFIAVRYVSFIAVRFFSFIAVFHSGTFILVDLSSWSMVSSHFLSEVWCCHGRKWTNDLGPWAKEIPLVAFSCILLVVPRWSLLKWFAYAYIYCACIYTYKDLWFVCVEWT